MHTYPIIRKYVAIELMSGMKSISGQKRNDQNGELAIYLNANVWCFPLSSSATRVLALPTPSRSFVSERFSAFRLHQRIKLWNCQYIYTTNVLNVCVCLCVRAMRFRCEQKTPWFNMINPFHFISFCSIQFIVRCFNDLTIVRFLRKSHVPFVSHFVVQHIHRTSSRFIPIPFGCIVYTLNETEM